MPYAATLRAAFMFIPRNFMLAQYQTIRLLKDINPVLKTGMTGVILEVWDKVTFEVEFLDKDGFNYTYSGQATFTLKRSDIKPLEV